jgi:hypothetical protein
MGSGRWLAVYASHWLSEYNPAKNWDRIAGKSKTN